MSPRQYFQVSLWLAAIVLGVAAALVSALLVLLGGLALAFAVAGTALWARGRRRLNTAQVTPAPAALTKLTESLQHSLGPELPGDLALAYLFRVKQTGLALLANTIRGMGGSLMAVGVGEQSWIERNTRQWLDTAAAALRDPELAGVTKDQLDEVGRTLRRSSEPPLGFTSDLPTIKADCEWRVLQMLKVIDAVLVPMGT